VSAGRAVVAAASMVLALASCAGPSPDPAATRAIFLETCAPGGVSLEVRVCECAYERIVDDLDPGELADLDRRLRDDPDRLPRVVSRAALECAAEPLEAGG
jgi:hypothetical protein